MTLQFNLLLLQRLVSDAVSLDSWNLESPVQHERAPRSHQNSCLSSSRRFLTSYPLLYQPLSLPFTAPNYLPTSYSGNVKRYSVTNGLLEVTIRSIVLLFFYGEAEKAFMHTGSQPVVWNFHKRGLPLPHGSGPPGPRMFSNFYRMDHMEKEDEVTSSEEINVLEHPQPDPRVLPNRSPLVDMSCISSETTYESAAKLLQHPTIRPYKPTGTAEQVTSGGHELYILGEHLRVSCQTTTTSNNTTLQLTVPTGTAEQVTSGHELYILGEHLRVSCQTTTTSNNTTTTNRVTVLSTDPRVLPNRSPLVDMSCISSESTYEPTGTAEQVTSGGHELYILGEHLRVSCQTTTTSNNTTTTNCVTMLSTDPRVLPNRSPLVDMSCISSRALTSQLPNYYNIQQYDYN
ncbi:hypothetical protein J6590_019859 [Homalodisca vitripennis]|nr:hypothetical protein J6590_019859 [Homalodisca vitripennis]